MLRIYPLLSLLLLGLALDSCKSVAPEGADTLAAAPGALPVSAFQGPLVEWKVSELLSGKGVKPPTQIVNASNFRVIVKGPGGNQRPYAFCRITPSQITVNGVETKLANQSDTDMTFVYMQNNIITTVPVTSIAMGVKLQLQKPVDGCTVSIYYRDAGAAGGTAGGAPGGTAGGTAGGTPTPTLLACNAQFPVNIANVFNAGGEVNRPVIACSPVRAGVTQCDIKGFVTGGTTAEYTQQASTTITAAFGRQPLTACSKACSMDCSSGVCSVTFTTAQDTHTQCGSNGPNADDGNIDWAQPYEAKACASNTQFPFALASVIQSGGEVGFSAAACWALSSRDSSCNIQGYVNRGKTVGAFSPSLSKSLAAAIGARAITDTANSCTIDCTNAARCTVKYLK